MNRKQRNKNRKTAATNKILPKCPECGMREPHWIESPYSLQDIFDGREPQGFWTCPKFYGADGRRIEAV